MIPPRQRTYQLSLVITEKQSRAVYEAQLDSSVDLALTLRTLAGEIDGLAIDSEAPKALIGKTLKSKARKGA